jgi:hypothetical protein
VPRARRLRSRDHGVNALEEASLIKEINRRGLGLTICPISNSYVTDGLKAQEIKSMLDLGVAATINSDDPAYFAGYMNENFKRRTGGGEPDPRRDRAAGTERVLRQLGGAGRQGPIRRIARGLPRQARVTEDDRLSEHRSYYDDDGEKYQ